ncbi:hypothetical protein B0G57_104134 [Trinickia symbiotica]|uniref:Uncharacterized protein n=1 Tax=Trinickia symbiotica TaxID=863227 RepID=A0A2N7X2S4_9BURK|nr:hypothetical protein C0Z20_14465 [Trinickia symbiotica]PPK45733.1 hypothetical protein B0G57_104134 [Trinickia symbiotica]
MAGTFPAPEAFLLMERAFCPAHARQRLLRGGTASTLGSGAPALKSNSSAPWQLVIVKKDRRGRGGGRIGAEPAVRAE